MDASGANGDAGAAAPAASSHKSKNKPSTMRSFAALTKKNYMLKRKSCCGTCCELALPILFIIFMNSLQGNSNTKDAWLPDVDVSVPSLSFLLNQTDAASGNVLCYDNNPLIRCACYEPLPATTTNDGVDDYYDKNALRYPVQAYFSVAHSDSAYTGICEAIFNTVTTAVSSADANLCEYVQLGLDFCPSLVEAYYPTFYSEYIASCPTLTTSLLVDEAAIQEVTNQAIALADSVGAGWSLTGANLVATCQTLHLAIAPVQADCAGDEACNAATAFVSYINTKYPTLSSNVLTYESEDAILSVIKTGGYSRTFLDEMIENAVIFDGGSAADPQWSYTLRTNFSHTWTDTENGYYTWSVPSTKRNTDVSIKDSSGGVASDGGTVIPFATQYFTSSVLSLQQTLDQFIVYTSTSGTIDGTPNYWVSPYPNGEYDDSDFWTNIGATFAIALIIVFIFPVNQVIKSLVIEKELKIKEGMLQMGLSEAVYTWSWLVWFSAIWFVLSIVMTILGASGIFKNSDLIFIFAWFFLFLESSLMLCFLISTFFSKARSAATFGSMMFFLTLFPYFAINESSSQGAILGMCVIPTACFAAGTLPFADFEDSGQGITSNTLYDSEEFNVSFGGVLSMLLFDLFFYGFLAWYATHVVKSEWGTSEPWNFLFTKAYWRPGKAAEHDINSFKDLILKDEGSRGTKGVEPVSAQLRRQLDDRRCVIIRDLNKSFPVEGGLTVEAVKQLNITMYKGQITALLGHNGAGKTTTMNMLSGMIPVTSGHALVNGLDVKTQMTEIRQQLGVCPQHDILYNELTVRHHLRMYATFKGVPRKQVNEEVDNMLRAVGLTEKADELTKSLSGGQKRKLSVGIAFIGGSSIVFLDEPTSGMDPFSRRFTWNIIRKQKEGRVIILTTHFMDEADLLGDRIAIMAHGELKCLGSSLFLKNNYGVGYNLTIAKNVQGTNAAKALMNGGNGDNNVNNFNGQDFSDDEVEKRQRAAIHTLVCSHVSKAVVLSDVGAEIAFQLPSKASAAFEPLLLDLDNHLKEYGITSYGMGVTTLEEVFLRVAHGTADEEDRRRLSSLRQEREHSFHAEEGGVEEKKSEENGKAAPTKVLTSSANGAGVDKMPLSADEDNKQVERLRDLGTPEKTTKPQRFRRHVYALLVKRVHNFKRDKKIIGFSLFAPSFFILVGMLVLLAGTSLKEPALELTMDKYNTGIADADRNPLYFPNDICEIDPAINPSGTVTCDSATFVTALPTDVGLQMRPTDEIDANYVISNMSQVLLETLDGADATKASRYGAFAWHELDTTANVYDVTAMCNYTAFHIAPTMLNLAGNAALRLATGGDESTTGITVTMHPLPPTKYLKGLYENTDTFPTVIFIMIGYAFIPAAWAGVVVREREGKMKHQQVVSGVSLMAFWISAYIWDLIIYFATPVIAFILLGIFGTQGLTSDGGWGPLVLLLLLFGPAATGFTYITSFNFTTYASAMSSTLFINWATGLLLSMTTLIMLFFNSMRSTAKVLKWIFRVFPMYCVGDGLFNLAFRDILAFAYGKDTLDPWSWQVTLGNIVFLVVESVLYLFITLYLEKVSSGTATLGSYLGEKKLNARINKQDERTLWDADTVLPDGTTYEDEDVVNERLRVQAMSKMLGRAPDINTNSQAASGQVGDSDHGGHARQAILGPDGKGDVISLEGLRKVYLTEGGGLKVAVRNQWLGIAKGEVFGLLGINGAGKTTTMAMLCGEQTPTKGRAFLAGMDIASNPEDVHRMVGYCPQFDALFDTMTGREHLQLYARIKCIPEENIAELIEGRIAQMGLERYADKLAGSYSGGNKRKLSVAISLLGRPELIMLDEPSTGVDPMARRGMWEVINRVITHNKEAALILTTHSMEECEALCQRMGIMVGGRLRCLGSTQHLKSRFGQGYQLEMTVLHPSDEQVAAAARKLLVSASMMVTGVGDDTETAVPVDLDQKLNKDQVTAAMEAYPSVKHEISATGFGADFYEELLGGGSIVLEDLASWCATEMAVEVVKDFVLTGQLQGCSLLEKQGGRVRFLVPPQPKFSLGAIFGLLESSHAKLGVEEYGLGQTSLEQIFNTFAALQEEETGPAPGIPGMTSAQQNSSSAQRQRQRSLSGAHEETADSHRQAAASAQVTSALSGASVVPI